MWRRPSRESRCLRRPVRISRRGDPDERHSRSKIDRLPRPYPSKPASSARAGRSRRCGQLARSAEGPTADLGLTVAHSPDELVAVLAGHADGRQDNVRPAASRSRRAPRARMAVTVMSGASVPSAIPTASRVRRGRRRRARALRGLRRGVIVSAAGTTAGAVPGDATT